MSELVSLKHTNTFEEYYEDFLAILNSLQLSDEYSLSVFISDLKPEISKIVRLFLPKNLTHALTLAKQIESLNPITNRRTWIPYRNPLTAPPHTPISTTFPSRNTNLPPLLPTSNVPPLPSTSYPPKYPPTSKTQSSTPTNSARTNKMPTRRAR